MPMLLKAQVSGLVSASSAPADALRNKKSAKAAEFFVDFRRWRRRPGGADAR